MPDEYEPSTIKQALLEKGMDSNIANPETAKLDNDLYQLLELSNAKNPFNKRSLRKNNTINQRIGRKTIIRLIMLKIS